MCGYLRLNVQAGRGTPGGEIRNEGTGGLLTADGQCAGAGCCQHLAVILADGADCQLGIAHIHLDLTGHIIINNNTGCAHALGDHCFFFEGIVTTADQGDLAGHIQSGIVSGTANAGNSNISKGLGAFTAQQCLNKLVFLAGLVGGLVKVDDGLAIGQVGSLHAVDGCNGQNTGVSTGRTDSTDIGVGGQRQVTVGLGAVSGAVAVGSCNHDADTGGPDLVINAAELLFVHLTGKAAGSTQGHIHHINIQDHAVLQSGQDPSCAGSVHNIGEGLHGDQLCVGGNTGNGVILTDNNTGNVGAVVIMGGVGIGVIVGVVVAERHFLVDVNIVHAELAAGELVSLGPVQHCCHILIGHAQMGGGEIVYRESGVVGIQTGIQNRNHHAGAVIAGIAALENTGFVDVNGVFNQLAFSGMIDLADDGILALAQRHTNSLEITCLNADLEATQQGVVQLTGGICNTLLIQHAQEAVALGGHLLCNFSSLITEGILGEAHGLSRSLVSIHQIQNRQRDNDRYLLVIFHVCRQGLEHFAVQVGRVVYLYPLQLIDRRLL